MKRFLAFISPVVLTCFGGCAPEVEEESTAGTRFLYVASGLCQSGANTTFTATTASNLIYRIDTSSGQKDLVLADYNALPAVSGETPVGISPLDQDHILALVERAGARRVEKIKKEQNAVRVSFSMDTTALANTLIAMKRTADGGYFVSRTNAVARLSSTGLTSHATFSTNAPGGTCGTNNKFADLTSTQFGHMVFVNSVASNNRVGIVKNTGGTASCLAATNAPVATAFPSAIVWIPEASQVIVAYSGSSVATNVSSIYVYDVTETATTASLGAGTKLYDAADYPATEDVLLYAVSAMAYDPSTRSLYLSTAVTTATTVAQYVIERFQYDSVSKTMSRSGSRPFYNYGIDTKCISGMFIAN